MPEEHADAHATFDARLPLDAFHGSEHHWQIYLAVWAALAVLLGLVTRVIARRVEPTRRFSWPLFAGLLTFLPSARDFGLVLAGLGLLSTWILAARFLSPADRLVPLAKRAYERALGVSGARFALALFFFSLASYVALGWLVFRFVPVIQDSQAQLWHARLLASGRFTAATPPLGDFFLAENMIQAHGRWYSIYPLGHILPLAVGVLAGAPFLVNPLLGAGTCVLVWATARIPFGERTARVAAGLAAFSPFVAYMSAEYMNHSTAAFAYALELYAVVRLTSSARSPSLGVALALGALAGLGAGILFDTKPLTCAALNLPVALFLAHRALVARAPRVVPASLALAAAAACVCALQLEFNRRTTGDPLLFGYAVGYPHLHYGFVESMGQTHTAWRGLEYSLRNANALDLYLLPLPLPGLALAIWAWAKHRSTPATWLFGGGLVSAILIYAGWYFQDLTFGPRYMFEASVGLYPLAALALPSALRAGAGAGHVARGAVVCVAIGLVSVLPGLGVYYRTVYAQDGGVVAHARAELTRPALVFVEGKYQRAFWAVGPDLDAPILFARDLGARDVELACAHPERSAYVEVDGRLVELDAGACSGPALLDRDGVRTHPARP